MSLATRFAKSISGSSSRHRLQKSFSAGQHHRPLRVEELESRALLSVVSPIQADKFVDSIGINTHITTGGYHALSGGAPNTAVPWSAVKADLLDLGIRHIRDPLWGSGGPAYYAGYNDLADEAIPIRTQATPGYLGSQASVDAWIDRLQSIPNYGNAVEGVEGHNEPDIFDIDPNTPGTQLATPAQVFTMQQRLYASIKAEPVLGTAGTNIPVLAPPTAGNSSYSNYFHDNHIEAYADYANSHAYLGQWMPENHSNYNYQTGIADYAVNDTRPQVMTETAWVDNDTGAGIYAPRILLYTPQLGMERTYYFQMVKMDGFNGLYDVDGSIKPQGYAVKNLISTLKDYSAGETFQTSPLDYTLSGDTTSLSSQLFQKRDGSYYLALSRAYEYTNTSMSNVTLTLNNLTPSGVTRYTDLENATMTSTPMTPNKTLTFPVGTKVVLVKLTGALPGPWSHQDIGVAPIALNAGFETPDKGAAGWQYGPITGASWTFASGAGIAANGSNWVVSNSVAPEGDQVAFIQGDGANSHFEQTFSGWQARTYTVSCQAAKRGNNPGGSTLQFQVLVDGVAKGTFEPTGTSYASFTTSSFTVGAGSHTVQFKGTNGHSGDNSALIDQVVISEVVPVAGNAGFETPDLAPNTWQYGGGSWTLGRQQWRCRQWQRLHMAQPQSARGRSGRLHPRRRRQFAFAERERMAGGSVHRFVHGRPAG